MLSNRLWTGAVTYMNNNLTEIFGVYLGVKTWEVFLCFVAIVGVRVYYVDFFVFFILRHWWVLQVLTPRKSLTLPVMVGCKILAKFYLYQSPKQSARTSPKGFYLIILDGKSTKRKCKYTWQPKLLQLQFFHILYSAKYQHTFSSRLPVKNKQNHISISKPKMSIQNSSFHYRKSA